MGVSSPLLPCEFQGSNLGHWIWLQVSLPAEPSQEIKISGLIVEGMCSSARKASSTGH